MYFQWALKRWTWLARGTKMKEQRHSYLDLGGKFHYGNCNARKREQKSARSFPYRDLHVRSVRHARVNLENRCLMALLMIRDPRTITRTLHVISRSFMYAFEPPDRLSEISMLISGAYTPRLATPLKLLPNFDSFLFFFLTHRGDKRNEIEKFNPSKMRNLSR